MKYTIEYEKYLDKTLKDPIFKNMPDFKILVSGATGMIGSCIVDLLMRYNELNESNIQVYALGRSVEKAKKRFNINFENSRFHFIQQDVMSPLNEKINFDYVIHAASNADPKLYAEQPVETLLSNILGMENLLKYTKDFPAKRILFVSSGEMYGQSDAVNIRFNESDVGYLDYSSPRSCYPAGKRAAEVLCQSYISEHGVDAVIVRPCHTYGPTMLSTDNRAVSAFIRNGVNHEDIILKSEGKQIRSHCMVGDSATAIFYALFMGKKGEAYNISADDSTYSIKEVAEIVCEISNQKIIFDIPTKSEVKGYSKMPVSILNNKKIKKLGWHSQFSLYRGIKETISILSASEEKISE